MSRFLGSLIALLLLPLSGCQDPEDLYDLTLAAKFAPVFYHDVKPTRPNSDLPCLMNFDGDWISNNNWENLEDFANGKNSFVPKAYVYTTTMETATHWFLFYGMFHPQDWDDTDAGTKYGYLGLQHENDFEGAMVVVRKSTEKVDFVSVNAHGDLDYRPASQCKFLNDNGRNVAIYVEQMGHGMILDLPPTVFPDFYGLLFRHTGIPEYAFDPALNVDPTHALHRKVGYALTPIWTIWLKRHEPAGAGQFFGKTYLYLGVRYQFPKEIGSKMDGNNWKADVASMPWNFDDDNDGPVNKGDWFLDPAYTFQIQFPGVKGYSTTYTRNRFLGIK